MDSKRQKRLKLAKRLSKINFESKHVGLPEEDCTIDDNDDTKLKQDEEKYRVEPSLTIKDERLKKLREQLEKVDQTFHSSSFTPFPNLGLNNQKDLSLNENTIFNYPQWTPFPSVCIECATNPQLLSLEINNDSFLNKRQDSSSQETISSLFPCSFQTNESPKSLDERNPSYQETESESKMKSAIDSSPDLFGQFSPENQKFQTKQRTFQHSNSASKVLFPESSRNQNKDLLEDQEIISTEKSIQSCPLCQEKFPQQMSQLDIDGHIAQCFSVADEDIVW